MRSVTNLIQTHNELHLVGKKLFCPEREGGEVVPGAWLRGNTADNSDESVEMRAHIAAVSFHPFVFCI